MTLSWIRDVRHFLRAKYTARKMTKQNLQHRGHEFAVFMLHICNINSSVVSGMAANGMRWKNRSAIRGSYASPLLDESKEDFDEKHIGIRFSSSS
jgi:hypothetical protein